MHIDCFDVFFISMLLADFPACMCIIVVALWNRADHCIFILFLLLLLSFFLA